MEERYINVDPFLAGLFELKNELAKGMETVEKCIELNDNAYPSTIAEEHLFRAYHSLENAEASLEHEISRLVGNKIVQSKRANHQ